MRSSILLATVALVFAMGSNASNQGQEMSRRHHSKVARDANKVQLQKRSFSGLATFYGMSSGDQGACGNMLNANDFTVALNEVQYGDLNSVSSYCDKTITISNGVKSTQAKITDACPTGEQCHYGALDMSKSLFEFFNPTSVGVFPITWWIDGEGSSSDSSSSSSSSSSPSSSSDSSDNDSSSSSSSSSNSNSANDKAAAAAASAKKAAAAKAAQEAAAAKKAAAAKAAKEAAAKKAAAEKKAAAAKKAAAEQKAKAAQAAKIQSAQKENIASFGEIMEALNNMVEDAMTTNSTSNTTTPATAA